MDRQVEMVLRESEVTRENWFQPDPFGPGPQQQVVPPVQLVSTV